MSSAFSDRFAALTDRRPFPWQEALYERFVKGDLPQSCNIPTGLGKTAVIPIWLLALAEASTAVPRRLIYVVNRRTVVDQATVEAEKVREKLGSLTEVCGSLRKLCAFGCEFPLAISTLRGQFADNAEWRTDPARPTIVVGTVDMIGSRLLFSGYRCGYKSRPLHAGFLGQDALVVHDEAHLEPAFQELLDAICSEQVRCRDHRPLRVMQLTATSRKGEGAFGLTKPELDGKVPEVEKRIRAKKSLVLHVCQDKKKIADRLAELALAHKTSGAAILLFARTVEDVNKVVGKLRKDKQQVTPLTGTMRGHERDKLVDSDPVFRRFRPGATSDGKTAYLVCTSAGEVGVNISADHLLCDLMPFDSMAQRFGRVNRFGNGDARIDVVHLESYDEEDPYDGAMIRTLALLRDLHGDGCPAALNKLDAAQREAAFTPPPIIPEKSDILFDAWAMTTFHAPLPGRPPVTDYLHGVPDNQWEPPETYVAWREEVQLIDSEELLAQYPPNELLEDYPLKPQELLRDRTSRVFEALEAIVERLGKTLLNAWILRPDADVEVVSLTKLVRRDKQRQPDYDLGGCIVILPRSAGGLRGGSLDGESETADDVADQWFDKDDVPLRKRVWNDEKLPIEMKRARLVRELNLSADTEQENDDETAQRLWRWYVRPHFADDDGSRLAEKSVALCDHCQEVECKAEAIAKALGLNDELVLAAKLAGRYHDLGKSRPLWQRTIKNYKEPLLAKSGTRHPPAIRTPYRHEFGSLLDLEKDKEFQSLDQDLQDFVLHLVAVHHGRGRPHFPDDEVFDPRGSDEACQKLALEIPLRFVRLQRKFGRWGLCYLESILRAADAEASARPIKTVEESQ